jgi:hypothetical protein
MNFQEFKMGKKSLMDEAISCIQKGQTEQARKTLEIITQEEPMNEESWLLLSKVVGNPKEEVECLSRVISINPDNIAAKLRISQLFNLLKEKGLEEKEFSLGGLAESSDAAWEKLKSNHIDFSIYRGEDDKHLTGEDDKPLTGNIKLDKIIKYIFWFISFCIISAILEIIWNILKGLFFG